MKYWDPIETISRDELEKLQLQRLKKTIEVAVRNSSHYSQQIPRELREIRSLKDLEKLPTMKKDDIRKDQESKPFLGNMLCVPEEDVVYISSSSGSTGMPTSAAARWASNRSDSCWPTSDSTPSLCIWRPRRAKRLGWIST